MPLASMYETLTDGLNVRIAEDDHLVPSVELKFATDEFDRVSLYNTVTVELNDRRLRVSSLEFQIAYKLGMGGKKTTRTHCTCINSWNQTLRLVNSNCT